MKTLKFLSVPLLMTSLLSCQRSDSDFVVSGLDSVSKEVRPEQAIQTLPLTKAEELISVDVNSNAAMLLENRAVEAKESFVFSPASLQYLVGMACLYAEPSVAQDIICQYFGKGTTVEQVADFNNKLIENLPALDLESMISLANMGISDRAVSFPNGDLLRLNSNYMAPMAKADLQSNCSEVLSRLNGWAREHTNGLIENVISDAAILYDSELVFANALFFESAWATPFECQMKRKFQTFKGGNAEMYFFEGLQKVRYCETDNFDIIGIPVGPLKKFDFLIILPKNPTLSGDDFKGVSSAIDFFRKTAKEEDVNVVVPVININNMIEMGSSLSSIGIDLINRPVVKCIRNDEHMIGIRALVQSVDLKMDLEGIRAAASAVAVLGEPISSEDNIQKRNFVANHPFCFCLMEQQSGIILFAGDFTGR